MSLATRRKRDGVDRDSWGTPREWLEFAREHTPPGITNWIDPCPSERSRETLAGLVEPSRERLKDATPAELEDAIGELVVVTRAKDAERRFALWVNPPYSRLSLWAPVVAEMCCRGIPCVWLLVPQRTETDWWRRMMHEAIGGARSPDGLTERRFRAPGGGEVRSYGWVNCTNLPLFPSRSVRIYEPPRRIQFLHPETGQPGDRPKDQVVLVRICWLPSGVM